MTTLETMLQVCAVAFVAAWVLTCYPPEPGEALWEIPHGWMPAGVWTDGRPPVDPDAWIDPARVDFASDGVGALSSIVDTPEDPELISARERQAQVDAWVHEPVEVGPLCWAETDAALRRLLAPLDRVEQAHVAVDSMPHDPVAAPTWRTTGTMEQTGEIMIPRELIGASA